MAGRTPCAHGSSLVGQSAKRVQTSTSCHSLSKTRQPRGGMNTQTGKTTRQSAEDFVSVGGRIETGLRAQPQRANEQRWRTSMSGGITRLQGARDDVNERAARQKRGGCESAERASLAQRTQTNHTSPRACRATISGCRRRASEQGSERRRHETGAETRDEGGGQEWEWNTRGRKTERAVLRRVTHRLSG